MASRAHGPRLRRRRIQNCRGIVKENGLKTGPHRVGGRRRYRPPANPEAGPSASCICWAGSRDEIGLGKVANHSSDRMRAGDGALCSKKTWSWHMVTSRAGRVRSSRLFRLCAIPALHPAGPPWRRGIFSMRIDMGCCRLDIGTAAHERSQSKPEAAAQQRRGGRRHGWGPRRFSRR